MSLLHASSREPKSIAILYHSAAGGTRVVAELLAELLAGYAAGSTEESPEGRRRERTAESHQSSVSAVRATSITSRTACDAARSADFIVLCYPTYFLRPSTSMTEFINRLAESCSGKPVYLITTYELYTENSLRACAIAANTNGMVVVGSAALRAPGSDLTCVFPDWLCAYLYRFEPRLPAKLRSVAREVVNLASHGGRERIPPVTWYTPVAHALQRAFFDSFIESRNRIRILPERCTNCGACITRCYRGAWIRHEEGMTHRPERCELCTACIHHCPRQAIVLAPLLKDNRRLDARHYAGLKTRIRRTLVRLDGATAHQRTT
jgi:ferredoxin